MTKQTSWISIDLKNEFTKEIETKRESLLSNIVIDGCIRKLSLKPSVWAILVVTGLLTLALFGVTIAISLLFNRSLPKLTFSALASFLTAFSFGIIKFLDHYTFSSGLSDFPRNIVSYATDNETLTNLNAWLRSYMSLKKQLIVSLAVAGVGTLSIFIITQARSIDFKVGSYFLLFLCFVGIGQGAYCAVVIPTLARRISKQHFQLFWFRPADSPWINDASAFFTRLSVADAAVVFLVICGLFLLRPFESTETAWVAGVWLVIGIVVLSYTFLFPHHYLTQVIKNEKRRQLEDMQRLIASYEARADQLTPAEYTRLLDHINLYNCLSGSRDNSIDVEAWFKYVSSIGIPIVAFIGGLAAKRLGLA